MIIILNCSKINSVNFNKVGVIVKKIDGNRVVYDLIQEHPELKAVLVELGFKPLANERMLNTVGRMMSLNNGAKQIKLSPEDLQAGLRQAGFELAD